MAEHLNQAVEVEMSPFNRMGKPLGERARGLPTSIARRWVLSRRGRGSALAGCADAGTRQAV
jgi:hypothetical protein